MSSHGFMASTNPYSSSFLLTPLFFSGDPPVLPSAPAQSLAYVTPVSSTTCTAARTPVASLHLAVFFFKTGAFSRYTQLVLRDSGLQAF